MTDTLFIQFFNQTKSGYYALCNGFSDVYDLCRSKGDFYWVEHEADNNKWYDQATYQGRELPIKKGRIYVSASYINHLYQAYTWAKQYPNIQFVVGGPVASERCTSDNGWHSVHFNVEGDLPENLSLTGKSVEALFGKADFSGTWKLDVPEQVPANSRIYFSYTLENMCYWKKCPFCSIAQHAPETFRKRDEFYLEFKDLDYDGHKIVRLNTGSITPGHIRKLLPAVPANNDIEYRFFMRTARAENKALKEVLERTSERFPDCTIGFGIEFPSNHMWHHLNKGTSMEAVFESISLCHDNGIKVNANVILGWKNLTREDLADLKYFMETIENSAVTTLQLRWLFAHPYTEIHESYNGGEPVRLGPFNSGFNVKLTDAQMALNLEAAQLIKEYCSKKSIHLEGFKNLQKGH